MSAARTLIAASLCVSAFGTQCGLAIAADDDFYKSKTVRIVVGYPPGGGYDVYARVIAQFLPAALPGLPTVIVQNMPGAGSITLMNHLYKVAEKDGTIIGAVSGAAPFAPLQGVKAANFDATKYNWVGSPNSETGMLIVWHTVPVQTIQDAIKSEIIVGSSSENSSTSFYARVLNATLGLKLKIIHGYPGTTESYLAMERGEIQGYPSAFLSSLQATRPDWIKGAKVKVLVQYGSKPSPDLPNVPFARDVTQKTEDKALLDLAMAPLAFGRPLLLPPDVPSDRVRTVRETLQTIFASEEFAAEAQRQRVEVSPVTGEELQAILAKTYGSPPALRDRFKELFKSGQ
jgi:tripartite-type tricarboxylate transporter receptor subunit TctC